jgi:hypothetical protein
MEKISEASRAYKCSNGETVTMRFNAHNTDLRITYRFDDEDAPKIVQGNSLAFSMTKPLRILRVFFHFINEAGTGGSYDIELRGSTGGTFADPPPVLQAGEFVPFRRYAFLL